MSRRAAGAGAAARRIVCAAGLLLAVRSGPTAEAAAANVLRVERPESEVLLLARRLDATTLAETLPAYGDRGSVLVPLGELCRLLDLAIAVDADRGRAAGFVIDAGRPFLLDVPAQRVLVAGKQRRFNSLQIEIHRDDIYVEAVLLSEWLPMRLDVDLYRATITVRPIEKLPMQLRLQRAQKMGAVSSLRRPARPPAPRQALPYRALDGPFVDQTVRYASEALPQGGSRESLEYTTYATGDVLFMEGNAFVAGNSRGLAESRFSLRRRDPDGKLLGLLRARDVALGDVFHPGLDLIASPVSGPGVVVSNFPLQLPTQFDRQSFRGDLPPGWEAELYRGAELLAYAQSRPDGLYEFLDVPLLFGLNLFRVELYGPQGQRRSETHRFNIGDALTPRGQFHYRLAGSQPGYRLFGTSPTDAGSRASFEVSAGLTRNLSASVSLASVGLLGGRHTYGKAALRAYWAFLFANLDVAADRDGGSAWQATLQSRLGPVGLHAQHAQLDDFASERFASVTADLRSRTTLRLDTAIPESALPRIPVLVELRQDRFVSGEETTGLSARVSAFRRGLAVANQLSWSSSSGGPALVGDTASGQLLVSKYLQVFSLRGEVSYLLVPISEVKSVALTAETRVGLGLLVAAGVSQEIASGETRLQLGASKLEGAFGLIGTADYSTVAGLGASVQLAVSIGRDARTGTWHSQARPLAGAGALSARAFLDSNGNGVMDAGEEPIVNAGLLLDGGQGLARTNERGVLFLPNLAPHRDVEVELATSTLEDPFWKPAEAAVRVLPRPGKVAIVELPVRVTGEITGTVFLQRDGEARQVGGVELELVDQKGLVVQRVRSAYDGFYDISGVEAGGYTLSVAAEHVVRLRVVARSRVLTMLPSGTVLDGVDFVLRAAAAPRVAATTAGR